MLDSDIDCIRNSHYKKRIIPGLKYSPPIKIQVVGSYLLGLTLSSNKNVDLLLTVPLEFKEKDHLNFRFHLKIESYMCYVAEALRKFTPTVSDPYDLSPQVKFYAEETKFKLHFTIPQNIFKLQRLLPDRNSIRHAFMNDTFGTQLEKDHPTPLYNNTIAKALNLFDHMQILHQYISEHENVKEGIILFKLWSKRQNFSGFVSEFVALFLIVKEVITINFSPFQVFKACLAFLRDFSAANVYSIAETVDDAFVKSYPAVFVDQSGFVNLFASLSLDQILLLSFTAKHHLYLLEVQSLNVFDALFSISNEYIFDEHYELEVVKSVLLKDYGVEICKKASVVCSAVSVVDNILSLALRDRARIILTEVVSEQPEFLKLRVRIVLNQEFAFSLVDKATEETGKEFRMFWGQKSELRRFKSGEIVETVSWEHLKREKHKIPFNICKHVLELKLRATVTMEKAIWKSKHEYLQLEKAHTILLKSLADLNLPLDITGYSTNSSSLRRMDKSISLSKKKFFRQAQSHSVFIHLEASNAWPHDLEAVQHLKAAFYVEIAESLEFQSQVAFSHVDVVVDSFLFRIQIVYEPEGKLSGNNVYYRQFIAEPRVSKEISNLCISNPLMSQLGEMVKDFIGGQLLGLHLNDLLVDSLVSLLFIKDRDYFSVPASLNGAFKRFLSLIANSNLEIGLNLNFTDRQKNKSGINVYTIDCELNFDIDHSIWNHFTLLCHNALTTKISKSLFVPFLGLYDFVLGTKFNVSLGVLEKHSKQTQKSENVSIRNPNSSIPFFVDANPVIELISLLQSDDRFMMFADPRTLDKVAFILKADVKDTRKIADEIIKASDGVFSSVTFPKLQ